MSNFLSPLHEKSPAHAESADKALARILRNHAACLESLRAHFLEGTGVDDPMGLSDEEFKNLCFAEELCGAEFGDQADAWEEALEQGRYLLSQTNSVENGGPIEKARTDLRQAEKALSEIFNRAFID